MVCWASEAEVVFLPCGHLCACASCAAPFLGGLACPMCRMPVSEGVNMGMVA